MSLRRNRLISNELPVIKITAQCLLPPTTKLGQGYVFTGICHSVNRGGVCLSACWDTTPPGSRHPPRADTPPEQTPPPQEQTPHPPEQISLRSRQPPWSRHPPGADVSTPPKQTPPRSRYHPRSTPPPPPPEQTPPPRCRACWEIRSTRGRYASYWNAILSGRIVST